MKKEYLIIIIFEFWNQGNKFDTQYSSKNVTCLPSDLPKEISNFWEIMIREIKPIASNKRINLNGAIYTPLGSIQVTSL